MDDAKSSSHPLDHVLNLARDRDASATIAGYVYQVDLTIRRWLELRDDEVLELERGEDIDRVFEAITVDNGKRLERVLEQIKRRKRSVNLKSESVREALAGFYEHCAANPSLHLRFRFTTNARLAVEKPNPFSVRRSGISTWEHLRATAQLTGTDRSDLAAVRQLLRDAAQPDGLADLTWRNWCDFLSASGDDALHAFIKSVEFSTGVAGIADLRTEIQQSLIDAGHVTDAHTARLLYSSLFTAVFTRLIAPGIKRLTVANLRDEIAGTGVGVENRALSRLLEEMRNVVTARLGVVETRLASVEDEVSVIGARVDEIAQASQPHRGALRAGDTHSFQTTDHYFGDELGEKATFSHARRLVGRGVVLDEALKGLRLLLTSDGGVALISGIGGVGKSRFMLEVARTFETAPDSQNVSVLWVRDDANINSATAAEELPSGPVLILCDDAHRRTDVQSLVAIAQTRSDPTAILLGTRPRGREAVEVAASLTGMDRSRLKDLGELKDLEQEELIDAVCADFDPTERGLADRIVAISGGSTVVALIGARLLRSRRLDPRVISLDAQARAAVFGGFEDELLATVGADDAAVARRFLELVSLAAPLPLSGANIRKNAASFLGIDETRLLRLAGTLEEAGVIRQHRAGFRIVPDVLSDYIAHRALVAANRATHYEERVIEALGHDVLPQLVRNIAELDWQIATHARDQEGENGQPGRADVFSRVWARLSTRVRSGSNSERRDLLQKLRPVANFQPARMLIEAEWLLDHPVTAEESEFGLPIDASDVSRALTPILAITALHEAYFDRAMDRLWMLAAHDERPPHSHVDHPLRQIEAVVGYSSWSDRWLQLRGIDALRRWTSAPGWSGNAQSPLVIATKVFETAVVEDSVDWNSRTVTMTRRAVNAAATTQPRLSAIDLLEELALNSEPRGRILASEALLEALKSPPSQYAHVVTDQEENQFRPQYERAFSAIDRVLGSTADPYVRLTLGDGLVGVWRQTRLRWKRREVRRLLASHPDDAATSTARVWSHRFVRRGLDLARGKFSYDRLDQAAVAAADAEITAIVQRAGDPPDDFLIDYFSTEISRIRAAGLSPQLQFLLTRLADRRSDVATDLAAWIICSDGDAVARRFVPWLGLLLYSIRESQPDAYSSLMVAAAADEDQRLRFGAARTLHGIKKTDTFTGLEGELLLRLVCDVDPAVREQAMEAVAWRPPAEQPQYLRVVQIGGNLQVAEAVASCWAYRVRIPAHADQRIRPKLTSGSGGS